MSQFRLHFDDLGFGSTDTYDDGHIMRGGTVSKGDIIVTKQIGAGRDQMSDSEPTYANIIRPLVQELRILSHPPLRDHPNIIEMFGLAWEERLDWTGHCWPIVVLEYANCGNLVDFFSLKDIEITWRIKLQFSQDILDGLAALHQSGVVHGDLKSDNVLIVRLPDGTLVAKLCDFGFAIIKQDYEENSAQVHIHGLTPRWAAPEVRLGTVSLRLAESIDIYAFGLVFVFILQNGVSPYVVTGKLLTLDEIHELQDSDEVAIIAAQNLQLQGFPDDKVEAVTGILCGTLSSKPNERSDLGWVKQALTALSGYDSDVQSTSDASMEDTSAGSPTSSDTADDETLLRALDLGEYDMFSPEPTNLEKLSDLPPLVENELQEDLMKKAKKFDRSKTDGSRDSSEVGRSAGAGYLLSVLLFQGLKGIQDWDEAMRWLILAAQAGSVQARLDLPRIALALNFRLPCDIQDSTLDWSESSVTSNVDRFVLDTLESIDESLYHRMDDEVRKGWMLGPYPSIIFGDEWEMALFDAASEYESFAHISKGSLPAFPKAGEWICHIIQATSNIFLAFLRETIPENGKIRALKPYGNGLTWIHFAATLGLIHILRSITFDVEIANVQDSRGRTPLFFATACGNSESAAFLLSVGANASIGHDDRGNTCLHFANLFEREKISEMIGRLIERGANVDAANNREESPIHRIIQSGLSAESNYTAVLALLRCHADPCVKDEDDEMPHFWAVMLQQFKTLKVLLEESEKRLSNKDFRLLKANLLDRLMFVPQYERLALAGPGYPGCLDDMIKVLADPETLQEYKSLPENGGDSVFFSASLRGATDIMKSLSKVCPFVDVNEPDSEHHRPPICYAIRHGKQNVFDTLISLDVDLFYRDNMNENALHASAEYAPEMLEQILELCRDGRRLEEMVAAPAVGGISPFDKAVINGHIDAAQVLLGYGANVNDFRCLRTGTIKRTILGYALQMPTVSIEQVRFLLESGATATVSQDQSTVFHAFAMRSQELEDEAFIEFEGESSKMPIFDLLLQWFPQAIHLRNVKGETPLHVASWAVRFDIVMRLCNVGVNVNATDRDGKTAFDKILLRKASKADELSHLLLRQKFRQEIERIETFLRKLQK